MTKKLKKILNGKIIFYGVLVLIAAIFVYNYFNPSLGVEGPREPRTFNSDQIKEILLEEAIIQNVTITEREMQSAYLGLQNKSEMSPEDYDAFILERHGSREAFDDVVENNLKVLKVINDNIDWSRIDIKDEDIDQFIAQNPEIFPAEMIGDPVFKDHLYQLARQQMFEVQRQQLITEYVENLVNQKVV